MENWWSVGINDDIVLVGLLDFQDDKVDIIHKYNYNDA